MSMEKEHVFAGAKDYRKQIQDHATALAQLLTQSPEYYDFIEARQKLEADRENSSLLNELRQQQMSLRMAAMLGEDVTEDSQDFENTFRLFTQDPKISEYLFAEGRFFRLIADVEKVFSDFLDIWHLDENTPRRLEHDLHLN